MVDLLVVLAVQDGDYSTAGAEIVDAKSAFGRDVVLKIRPPRMNEEVPMLKDNGR